MWYIKYIDELATHSTIIEECNWYSRVAICRPIQAHWLLKRKIRFIKARNVLIWKADAIKYKKQ